MTKKLRLENKVVLITGAAQGIGEEIARLFVREGAQVIVTDIQTQKGHAIADSIGQNFHHLDVAQEDEWMKINRWIMEKYGRLDVLVNNAGVTGFHENLGPQNPEEASLYSWHKVHGVNLDGVFLGCKYGIGLMKNTTKQGSIINISSRSGQVGIPGAAAYASSKGGVRNHTKTVALYCAEKGYPIRCNSIHPAVIITPMWEPMLGTGKEREKNLQNLAAEVPLKRVGHPQDVAYAALFLASEESNYMTGTEINIDGGIMAGTLANPSVHRD